MAKICSVWCRVGADGEAPGKGVVGEAFGQQEGDLGLPFRQPEPLAQGIDGGQHRGGLGRNGDHDGAVLSEGAGCQERPPQAVPRLTGSDRLLCEGEGVFAAGPPPEAQFTQPAGHPAQRTEQVLLLGIGDEQEHERGVAVQFPAIHAEDDERFRQHVEGGALGVEPGERVEAGLEGGKQHAEERELLAGLHTAVEVVNGESRAAPAQRHEQGVGVVQAVWP
ncbi:hypothetical protein GQ464_000905 [Rhodocaloribacter litoris]|nr:hypothetical protein [Rhodocaloribacter litoris]QXD15540.1 hypothetical protein GQ464_000905 [Rhodocaloribacter litoris]